MWLSSILEAEASYKKLRDLGKEPKWARSVLPNSLKAEIVVTANLREWRHIFSLRCDTPAHPQMRQITIGLLHHFKKLIPLVFDDLYERHVSALVGQNTPYLPNDQVYIEDL